MPIQSDGSMPILRGTKTRGAAVRYVDWSFEELRSLALQLQLPYAGRKSRKELLELLVGGPCVEGFQSLESPDRSLVRRSRN